MFFKFHSLKISFLNGDVWEVVHKSFLTLNGVVRDVLRPEPEVLLGDLPPAADDAAAAVVRVGPEPGVQDVEGSGCHRRVKYDGGGDAAGGELGFGGVQEEEEEEG